MLQFEEQWRDAKSYRIEAFKPFGRVSGQLWAPAYFNNRWRLLTLDFDVACDGARQVFTLAGDAKNIVSFVQEAMKRREDRPDSRRA